MFQLLENIKEEYKTQNDEVEENINELSVTEEDYVKNIKEEYVTQHDIMDENM